MRVTYNFMGKDATEDLATYVSSSLYSNDNAGIIEDNTANIESLRGAFARLIDVLAAQRLLNAEEISEVVQGFDGELELLEDE